MNSTPFPETSPTLDGRRFRDVLGHFPTGVVVVTAPGADGAPVGMAVGSFASVSIDPPLVAFFPTKSSTSFPRIRESGVFCVNILAASQEPVCRRFATSGADKFAGLRWRPAGSGSPILNDVVGWIDCTIDTIHEAGDHYVVIGRVTSLNIERPTVPLVFFQGGYGGFAPTSMATAATDELIRPLKIADRVLPTMETLSRELDANCYAQAVSGSHVVLVAVASCPRLRELPVRTGSRFPMVPPYGDAFAAWLTEEEQERWLDSIGKWTTANQHDVIRQDLREIRATGWAYTVNTDHPDAIEPILGQLRDFGHTPAIERELIRLIIHNGRRGDPAKLSSLPAGQVSHMHAPVFDAEGRLALMLSLHNFNPAATGADLLDSLDRLRAAARAASTSLATIGTPRD